MLEKTVKKTTLFFFYWTKLQAMDWTYKGRQKKVEGLHGGLPREIKILVLRWGHRGNGVCIILINRLDWRQTWLCPDLVNRIYFYARRSHSILQGKDFSQGKIMLKFWSQWSSILPFVEYYIPFLYLQIFVNIVNTYCIYSCNHLQTFAVSHVLMATDRNLPFYFLVFLDGVVDLIVCTFVILGKIRET